MNARQTQRVAVAWAITFGAGQAWAASILPVGVLSETPGFSEVRALSPDGRYAVGGSMNAEGLMMPYLWTAADGMRALSNPRGGNGWATGVDVRAAVGEIVVAAQLGGTGYRYNAPADAAGSGSWSKLAGEPAVSDYNALATFSNGDKYYISGYLPGSCASKDRGYRYRGGTTQDDFWSNGSKWETRLTSVAANGVVCGFDSSGAAVWTGPPAAYSPLPSARAWASAMAWGISSNGRWLTGTCSVGGEVAAFRWDSLDDAAVILAVAQPGEQAAGMDCSDLGTAVGVSMGSDGQGRATVWDATGQWGDADTAVAIENRLSLAGVDMKAWTHLIRANSISSDGLTIAGDGIWAADGSTRGWVATIPEPVGWMLLIPAVVWTLRAGREGRDAKAG